MLELEEEWLKLAGKYSENLTLLKKIFYEIEIKYSEKHRYYHNLSHIRALLYLFRQYCNRVKEPDTVLFAIWFHDIIYEPFGRENEEKSAELAQLRLSELGIKSETVQRVCDYILATKKHHASNDDYDLDFFLDLDLSVLGLDRKNYGNYALAIREENRAIPILFYRFLRKKVLKSFLSREHIYFTEELRKAFEQKARENMEAELKGKFFP